MSSDNLNSNRAQAGVLQQVTSDTLENANAEMASHAPSSCKPCAAAARQKSNVPSAPWTPECVRKILCAQDKKVVEQLRQTTIKVADSITYHDPYYDGKQWTTIAFTAGGNSDSSQKEIGMLSGVSCTEAATIIYHEVWHQNQPKGMKPADAEYDAYYNTEKWTIARGLPGDQGGTLRETDAHGNIVASRRKVEELVQKEYPVPPKTTGTPPPHPVDRDSEGNTILSNGTKRAPQKGDRYYDPNPPVVKNEYTIPPGDAKTSPWHCT